MGWGPIAGRFSKRMQESLHTLCVGGWGGAEALGVRGGLSVGLINVNPQPTNTPAGVGAVAYVALVRGRAMATAHMLLQVERTVGHKPTLRTGGGCAKVGVCPMDMRDQALLRDTQTTVRTVDMRSRGLPNHFRDGNKNFPINSTQDRS